MHILDVIKKIIPKSKPIQTQSFELPLNLVKPFDINNIETCFDKNKTRIKINSVRNNKETLFDNIVSFDNLPIAILDNKEFIKIFPYIRKEKIVKESFLIKDNKLILKVETKI